MIKIGNVTFQQKISTKGNDNKGQTHKQSNKHRSQTITNGMCEPSWYGT